MNEQAPNPQEQQQLTAPAPEVVAPTPDASVPLEAAATTAIQPDVIESVPGTVLSAEAPIPQPAPEATDSLPAPAAAPEAPVTEAAPQVTDTVPDANAAEGPAQEKPADQMYGGYTGVQVGAMGNKIAQLQQAGQYEQAAALTEQLNKVAPPEGPRQ
jgi:hypothetical protein